ncbi:MAG: hypothetical protein K6D97_06375, partial [Clostridia bacterium]|nr:hypothetical protein [Clostridia bacterium]
TWMRYKYSIKDLAISTLPFCYVLVCFPIIYIFEKDGNPYRLLRSLAWLGLINVVIRFVSGYSYSFMNRPIFVNFTNEYGNWSRDGIRRVDTGALFMIAFIYFIARAFEKKKRVMIYVIPSIIMYMFAVIINKARALYIAMIITSFIVFLLSRKTTISKAGVVFFGIMSSFLLFFSGVISSFLGSFSRTGMYGYSTITRLEALVHFWRLYKQTFLFGLGYLDNFSNTANLFYRNAWSHYYIVDLGILSAVFKFGIASIMIVVYLYILFFKALNNAIKVNYRFSILVTTAVVYFLTFSLVSGLYEGTNGFSAGIVLAIVSYADSNNSYSYIDECKIEHKINF